MSRMVLQCLCEGPKSVDSVAKCVAKQRADLPPKDARIRARHVLNNLSRKGLVVYNGRVWSIVLDAVSDKVKYAAEAAGPVKGQPDFYAA